MKKLYKIKIVQIPLVFLSSSVQRRPNKKKHEFHKKKIFKRPYLPSKLQIFCAAPQLPLLDVHSHPVQLYSR